MCRMKSAATQRDASPSLYEDPSFWGLTATQLLGAFNDNLFKQFVLLVAVVSVADASTEDRQSLAMAAFALPFILFSGFGGFLSDRYSKRTIIVLCKVAEIAVMVAATVVFYFGAALMPLVVVVFFMGAQSAFFGPAKYGVLPEMFAGRDLPRANGWIQLTTFLAIIFGTAAAGVLKTHVAGAVWMVGCACIAIALIGTATSLIIRSQKAAQPELSFSVSALMIRRDTWQTLVGDRPLLRVLGASSLFWFVGGLILPAVNALGKHELGLRDDQTSFLAAGLGVGIAFGCLAAGKLSGSRVAFYLSRFGCWGVVVCALVVWASNVTGSQMLGYRGSLLMLIVMGAMAGLFAVPLQVFLQARPPKGQKGRMIGAMNLLNWIGIFLSAGVYQLCTLAAEHFRLAPSITFLVVAAALLSALWLVPNGDEQLTS